MWRGLWIDTAPLGTPRRVNEERPLEGAADAIVVKCGVGANVRIDTCVAVVARGLGGRRRDRLLQRAVSQLRMYFGDSECLTQWALPGPTRGVRPS